MNYDPEHMKLVRQKLAEENGIEVTAEQLVESLDTIYAKMAKSLGIPAEECRKVLLREAVVRAELRKFTLELLADFPDGIPNDIMLDGLADYARALGGDTDSALKALAKLTKDGKIRSEGGDYYANT